jgi:hypothetical protein
MLGHLILIPFELLVGALQDTIVIVVL